MLHLLAAFDIQWPREGLINCLSGNQSDSITYTKAENQIAHLLELNEIGPLIFHNSLLVFITKQQNHKQYSNALYPKVIEWLQNKAPEYWKWAYECLIKAKFGDIDALRDGPSLDWVISSIAEGYPVKQIIRIIQNAAWCALDSDDLPRVVELNILWQYLSNALQFESETFNKLRFCQFRIQNNDILFKLLMVNLKNISDDDIENLSIFSKQKGIIELSIRCLKEYNMRMIEAHELDSNVSRDNEVDIKRTIILAIMAEIESNRILNFIKKSKSELHERDWFSYYFKLLYAYKYIKTFQNIVNKKINKNDIHDLITSLVRLSCEERIDLNKWNIDPSFYKIPLLACYCLLFNNKTCHKIDKLSLEILELKNHELYSSRHDIIRLYSNIFLSSFYTEDKSISDLIDELSSNMWTKKFCKFLVNIGIECRKMFNQNQIPSYSWIYKMLQEFPVPGIESSRDEKYLKSYATQAVVEIALDIFLLGTTKGGSDKISEDNCKIMAESPYWNREVWIDRYIENKRQLLDNDALEFLLENEQNYLKNTINQLNERALYYAKLAQLATIHGVKFYDKIKLLLRKSAHCLMGYGWRKDTLLYDTLNVIESCFNVGFSQCEKWMYQIAPLVGSIREFTDGDETNYLKVKIAELIYKIRPDLFPAYYHMMIEDEEWDYSEDIFNEYIKHVDINRPFIKDLLNTIVDKDGLAEIKERAENGETTAKHVFKEQERFLGGIAIKEEKKSDSEYDNEKEPPDPNEYPPYKLKEYMDRLRKSHYYKSEPILQWYQHWIEKNKDLEILESVKTYAQNKDYQYTLEPLLDFIFDLCLQIEGKSNAYKWLLKAHEAKSSWGRWYTNDELAKERFYKIAKYYPEKWLDFIKDGALPKFKHDKSETIPSIGFERLVDYCIILNQKEVAEKISEKIIQITIERIADLLLPKPIWLSEIGYENPDLQMIFIRSEWPSLMVRERSASSIIKLLKNKDTSQITKNVFVKWLKSRKLESLISNLLIAYITGDLLIKA